MIKIAICDDVCSTMVDIHKLVDDYVWEEDVKVVEYTDGLELMNDICIQNEQLFDLIITDIECTKNKEINAVDLFQKIQLRYPDIRIIYMAINDKYAMNVANSMPFGYIKKPINKSDIYELFDKYKKIENNKLIPASFFVFSNNKQELVKISYKRIKYVYSMHKTIFLVYNDGAKTKIKAKLDDIWRENFSQLEHYARANKNYIINLYYVENFYPKNVQLDDGTMISVGREYWKDLQERCKNFLFWDRN